MSDPRIELAYDALQGTLKAQDTNLSNLRNRATGLFSAAAVVTTFSTAVGLMTNDPSKGRLLPVWAAISSLVLVILIGSAVMYTLWPVRSWAFGPNSDAILKRVDKQLDVDAIRRTIVEKYQPYVEANDRSVRRRSTAYRVGIVLLGLEVGVLVLPITTH